MKDFKIFRWIDYKFSILKTGIQNIYTWFPIIWYDRQYDYYFLYKILNKKIELIRNSTYHNLDNFEDSYKTLKQMDFCIRRLRRLMDADNNFIHPEFQKRLETEQLAEIKYDEETGNYKFISKLTKDDINRYLEWEEKQKDRELNLLFGTIRKYIQTWWW